MENDLGVYYLYIEQTIGSMAELVREFTNQEELRQFAEGRMLEDPNGRSAKAYKLVPGRAPQEIVI